MNIYNALIYKKLYGGGGGGEIEVESLTATENKTYNAGEGKAYNPVVVAIPEPTLISKNITANGDYSASTDNADGYSSVSVNVPLPSNAYLLKSIENVNIATFTDGTDNFLKSLEVAIEPQQDLHGYDAPWVGGAGKNKLGKLLTTSGSLSGVTYTANSNGTFTVNGTNSSSGVLDYRLSGTGEYRLDLPVGDYYLNDGVSGLNRTGNTLYIAIESNGTTRYVGTNNQGTGSAFSIAEGEYISSVFIRLASGVTANNAIFKPMIRLATETDATFAPYSNECPISGWSACNVVRTGKNLFNKNTVTNGYRLDGSGNPYSASSYCTSDYIRVKPNTTYTRNLIINVMQTVCTYDQNKNFITRYGNNNNNFTTDNNACYVRTSLLITDLDNCQLEEGSTATTYEAYNGNTYTIQFRDGDNPLTVYGGSLDVVSGELVVTNGYIASYNGETLPSTWISDRDVYAEGTTPTIGAEVCYKLATPQTIQLTPTIIKSLQGDNNFFASTGEIERMQYWSKEVTS